jgi:hypothetical protein
MKAFQNVLCQVRTIGRVAPILMAILFTWSSGYGGSGRSEQNGASRSGQVIRPAEVPMISGGGLMGGVMRDTRPRVPIPRRPETSPPTPILNPFSPVLGSSFDGFDFDDNPTENSGFYFIPPDPSGAAGTDRVIAVVNTMIEARTKTGTLIFRDALADFFSSLSPATSTFDPKVLYDQYAGRFVVVTLERVNSGSNPDPGNVSKIFVAVSKTSSPGSATSADWYYHAIDAKTVISGFDYWADYPGFAIDEDAVYITNNMFLFPPVSGFGGVRLWIVHKGIVGGFYGGGAATVTVHNPYASAGIATTTQPAHVFGVGGVPGGAGLIGTFLVSYSGLTSGGSEFVQVVRVDDPLGTPTFTQEYVSVGDIDATGTTSLPDAPQSGTGTLVEVNDRRALNAVWSSGNLWLSTTLIPSSGADAGQTTAHWFKLSTSAVPGGAITLSDQGNIGGEDIAPTTYTFFPSIAVNATGDAVIVFSASASTIYPGSYFTGRFAGDPAGTNRGSGTLRAGLDYYIRTFGAGSNRWGDYSGASIDPLDGSFWIFHEYAKTRGTIFGGEDGRWATAFGNLAASALPVQLTYFSGTVISGGHVHLRWGTISEINNYGFEVQKTRSRSEQFQTIPNSFVPGHGTTLEPQHYEFVDVTSSPGTWLYRLKQIDLDGTVHFTDPIQVDVLTGVAELSAPTEFSLAQNYPNPFNPSTRIPFSVRGSRLEGDGSGFKVHGSSVVTLKVYDVLGREVATLVDEEMSPGTYEVVWDASAVASGVYYYQLQARNFVAKKKLMVLR